MRKDEVIRFLQLVKYYEVLPLNEKDTDYSKIGKYCVRTGFVNATPDRNCLISDKGWDLLNGKTRWNDKLPSLNAYSAATDKIMNATYLLAGATVGGIVIYELMVKVFLQ